MARDKSIEELQAAIAAEQHKPKRAGMAAILETYSADYTTKIHYAQRADGQWFTRIQRRDPRFGHKWGAWRPVPAGPERGTSTGQRARLPRRTS